MLYHSVTQLQYCAGIQMLCHRRDTGEDERRRRRGTASIHRPFYRPVQRPVSIYLCPSIVVRSMSVCLLPICPISTVSMFSRWHLPILFCLSIHLQLSPSRFLLSLHVLAVLLRLILLLLPSSSTLTSPPCISCLVFTFCPSPSTIQPTSIHPNSFFPACDLLFCMKSKKKYPSAQPCPLDFSLSIYLPLPLPLSVCLCVSLSFSLPPSL